VDHLLARQVLRQRPPSRLCRGALNRFGHHWCSREALGLVALQRLNRQLQLIDAPAQPLGRDPELRALETGQLEAQLLDQSAGVNRILRHAGDDALQRVNVIGQGGGIDTTQTA
jgi:hypothetical protein